MRVGFAGLCLAMGVGAAAGSAHAVPIEFTDSAAFMAAASLVGPLTIVDFDATASGAVIPSGGSIDGITFSYDFGGVDLVVTDGSAFGGDGPYTTTSSPNFLGTSDFDILQDGDDIVLSFVSANAIGLFIITAEVPGFTLFDEDLGLTAGGTTAFLDVDAIEEILLDGSLVFFLGVIDDAASFSSASLEGFGGGSAFLYNIDDVVMAVPEPSTAVLVALGLTVLALSRRYHQAH